jgi:transposase
LLADPEGAVPGLLQPSLAAALQAIGELETRIRGIDRQLETAATNTLIVSQLRLGLTPREHSSGARRRLGAISKRGDRYLRMLLIHGARAVLCHAKRPTARADRLRAWALHLERLRGHNKAAVALANKLARIAWALWTRGGVFTAQPAPAAG